MRITPDKPKTPMVKGLRVCSLTGSALLAACFDTAPATNLPRKTGDETSPLSPRRPLPTPDSLPTAPNREEASRRYTVGKVCQNTQSPSHRAAE
jgi:hypothetical protein